MQNEKWKAAYDELDGNIRECLNRIVSKIKRQQMIGFVGAGFSKNANTAFPDWAWLLLDLYREITSNIEMVSDDEIVARIRKEGESDFAQRYLDSGKSREKLDLYIEKKLKPLNDSHNWLFTIEQFLKINWDDVVTTNWDTILEQASKNAVMNYEIVKSAKELKNKSHKRIVKLNGTLRSDEEIENKVYEFDGIVNHLYIITTEDFKKYKDEHETFSNFMKVKFVENSICFFGFSGNDPNFRYWISELKKTMLKGGDTEIPNELFLINASDEPLDREMKQFFFNNFIFNIPLSELTKLLANTEKERKQFVGKDGKRLISAEFDCIFQKLYNLTQEQKISELVPSKSLEVNNFFVDMSRWGGYGLSKDSISKYIELPLFLYSNLNFSNNLLFNIQSYCKKTQEIDAEGFLFIYRWCVSNFYKLVDILPKDDFDALVNHYKTKVLPKDVNNPFSELILQFYRNIRNRKLFEEFVGELQKLGTDKNIAKYQELLWLYDTFNYEKFQHALEEWFPENDEKPNPLYILRKCRLFYAYNTDFHNVKLTNKINEIFKIAEEKCDMKNEPQLYLFILAYHNRLVFNFSGDKILQKKINDLKNKGYLLPYMHFEKITEQNRKIEDSKPNEDTRYSVSLSLFPDIDNSEKNNHFNVCRCLNYAEFSGLPVNLFCDQKQYYSLLKSLNKEDVYHLCLYLFNAIVFFGNSSNEEVLRLIVPKVLKCFNSKLLVKLRDSVLNVIDFKIKNEKNPKTYIYFLTEILKRLDVSECEKIFEFYINLIKNENKLFFALIAKGKVWGIEKPFLFFLEKYSKKGELKFLLKWIIEKYVEDNEANSNNQVWSPWFSYLDAVCKNKNISDEVKSQVFQSEDIKKLLTKKETFSKDVFLYGYNFFSGDGKEKIKIWLENNFNLSIDAYYLQFIKSEKIKIQCLEKLNDCVNDKLNLGVSKISNHLVVLKNNYDLTNADYSKIYDLVIKYYQRFEMYENQYTKITCSEEVEGWFYLLGELHYKNDSTLKQKFEDLFIEVFEKYRETNKELIEFNWIYSADSYNFRVFTHKAVSYFSFADISNEEVAVYIDMILSRIIFSDSKEYEGVIKIILDAKEKHYKDGVLNNEVTQKLLSQLKKKFSIAIPDIYDDLFVKEQMKRIN